MSGFNAGAVTRSNRSFTRLSLNLTALVIATNNNRLPSKNVTKTYDATQRVKVDNMLPDVPNLFLDLEAAVEHNVDVMCARLKKKWKGNKYEMLIGNDDVAFPLAKTFNDVSKWVTTYKKCGISANWGERDEFIDSKHPHHFFLLHQFTEKLHMADRTALTRLKFKGGTGEHWKHLFHYIPEGNRRAGTSCLGWGDGNVVGPRGKKMKKAHRKSNK